MKLKIKIVEAPFLFHQLMCLLGLHAWISLGNTIYVRQGELRNKSLIRHKIKHIEQMEIHGKFLFSIKYILLCIRHGIAKNPFEVEARSTLGDEQISVKSGDKHRSSRI